MVEENGFQESPNRCLSAGDSVSLNVSVATYSLIGVRTEGTTRWFTFWR